ncbi:MAG: M56 family metallopeptidase [Pirellula sp.]|nr:M56 family metallopeptidase [Pirellula sp.]
MHVSSTPQESQFSPSQTDSSSLKLESTASLANTGLIALFWLWLAGAVGSLLLCVASRQQLSRILSRAKPLDRDDLVEHILLRRRALGIRRPIACLLIEDEIGPASTGLLRPKILIPKSLLSELNSSQLSSILEHEIHHIRRFDSVYLLLNKLVCCLHWFNPLAYWLATRVRSEMEYAVDAAMIAQGGDEAKKNYGDLLIHLACRRSSSLGLAPMAESQSNLKKRIEELFAPVRNTKIRSAFCFAAIGLLIATGLSEVVSTQEPTTTEAISSTQDPATVGSDGNSKTNGTRDFELLIVDTSGQSISTAQVEIRGYPKATADWIIEGEFIKQGSYGTFAKPTKDGRLKLLLPFNSSHCFSIKADGYGPYWAEWKQAEIPAKFKAELDLGRTVGGIVVDEDGQPIADAEVNPSVEYKKRPGDSSQLGVGTFIKTDSKGHWSYAQLPRAYSSFSVEITHPQYKPRRAKLSPAMFELLPNKIPSETIVMEKGLTVTGKIVDTDGKPIQGALIRTKVFNDIRSTQSDADGAYNLIGCQEGVARVVVSAPGMAVDMKSASIDRTLEPVNFTMQPGGNVRIRVMDEFGKPVPKARIFFQGWREQKYDYFEFDHVNQYADGNGVWEWNEAPLDEFHADICRPGGMALARQSLIARAEEYVFSCPPELVVVGRVIDAETKRPIEEFQVIPGVRSSPQHMNWVRGTILEAKKGSFSYTESHDYFAHLLKVQARGYLPLESRDIKSNEGRIELTFELKRGAEIDMRVMTPEGVPAQRSKVALGIPGAQISIENGDIDHGSTMAQTIVLNAAGRLRFPGQSTPYDLIITHESGFAHFRSDQAALHDLVQLTPWASVVGTFRVAKQPVGGVKIYLNSGNVHSYGDGLPSIFTSSETVTNQDGTFRFDRVFPGRGVIARSILRIVDEGAKEVASSTTLKFEFESNKTTRVDFGLSGCPVVGTLVKPSSYDDRVQWSFAEIDVEPLVGPGPLPIPDKLKDKPGEAQDWYNAWIETEAGKEWRTANQAATEIRRTSPSYIATCDAQGRFRLDDMPAGDYWLNVSLHERPNVGTLQQFKFSHFSQLLAVEVLGILRKIFLFGP